MYFYRINAYIFLQLEPRYINSIYISIPLNQFMQTKLELYQKVMPLANLGIWERNLLTGEMYWNEVVRKIYDVDEDYGPTIEGSVSAYVDQVAILQLIDDAMQSHELITGEYQIRTSKGQLKWVKIRVSSDYDGNQCRVLYGTIEDVTEKINLVHKLAEHQEQFHQAFEWAPIGMALVSLQGEWLRVNKMLCQILDRSEQELLAKTFQEITYPDDLELDMEQMHDLLEGKISSYHMEKRYLYKNGAVIWASLHVTLVRNQDGSPLYFISQIKDISEQKAMELERINTLEVITRQNERLLNFAHIVSHNLRSHAGNIQMLADIIPKESDPMEREEMINMIGINAANLQETLMHLNEVVNVHGHRQFNVKSLNLSKEIYRTIATLSESFKQAEANIVVQQEGEIEINYDPAYMESILLNLLTNSIKYRNPDRALELTIRITEYQHQIILEIQDNGLGMDLSLHGHKLFGMYKTFHGNEDARGVGLFLVKNQVEAMGGKISAESTPGVGTTFKIEFTKLYNEKA